jgi:ubiquinol-cytochrome c reductase cytochrome c1 subunit
MLRSFLLLFTSFLSIAFASDEAEFHPKNPIEVNWSFNGIFAKFDRASIQRGLKVYQQVCASCHSLNKISFRHLTDIGFTKDQVKAIAADYQIQDGPNDSGEYYERAGVLSDYFPSPYPNKQAAEAANNGAYPPDLSLIVRGRKNGANYIYSLLTNFTGEQSPEGLYYNPYFITGQLAMAPPLVDDMVTYDDETPATVNQMAIDIVNFLHWTAESEMEKRHSLGLKVMCFLLILLVLSWIAKKKVWIHLYNK